MTFGQTIRTLRRDAGMTQESLAELLSISPQAVSRWETDAAMPDISLLPPLATLFGVTTDRLLGMDTYQKDKRKAEYDEAFHEYWNHDDKEKNYRIAVRAAAEYPGNMEYVEWLASAEYYYGLPLSDDNERERLLESSVNHYRVVLDNSTDRKLCDKALQGIVLTLHFLGRHVEAKDWAMKQEDETKRDDMLCWCLEGDEKVRHIQTVAENRLGSFLLCLELLPQSVMLCDTVEQILKILFPDGNYQYYHNTLQYNSLGKAYLLCDESRFDEAMAELRKARLHAEAMVRYGKETSWRFTSPLFDKVGGEKNVTDSPVTDVDDFKSSLQRNRCFDPLREREEFKELLR